MVDFKVIRESFYRLRYLLYIFFLPLWWLQLFSPRRRDVWIFGAWYGRRFSDNSKYLYMYVDENCPDIRNTKVIDIYNELVDFGTKVHVYDPWANPDEVRHEYGLETTTDIPNQKFDAVVLGVSHNEFLNLNFANLVKETNVIYDVKGILNIPVDGVL